MEQGTIKSVAGFVEAVVELKQATHANALFFRGESAQFEKPCAPAIYRSEALIKSERFFFNEAQHRFPEIFSQCKTELDRLVLMQHYGVPTRLLDVTENPLVSLFFACEENNRDKEDKSCDIGSVFCIAVPFEHVHYEGNTGVKTLASLAGKGRGFCTQEEKYKKILFVKPLWIDERIKRQQGEMLLFGCGERKEYLIELGEDSRKEIYIKQKWCIPVEYKSKIRKELCALGVRRSYLFPNLENLTEEILGILECKNKK